MPKATCAVNVIFNIKPEHAVEFHEVVLRQAQNSLEKEPWCHQFDVCTMESRPNSFLLYETYDDLEAFAKHRQTEHFAEFGKTVSPWIESKDVTIWDISERP